MQHHGLHLARTCLLIPALGLLLSGAANASKTYVFKDGDTLSGIASRFGVTVRDIASWNNLSNLDYVRNGMRLTIPDAPKKKVVDWEMKRPATIRKDRVNIRISHDEDSKKLTTFDMGEPVLVTALHDGWAQIRMADGHLGWVRADFLKISGSPLKSAPVERARVAERPAKRQVARAEKPAKKHTAHKVQVAAVAKKWQPEKKTQVAKHGAAQKARKQAAKHVDVAKVVVEEAAEPETTPAANAQPEEKQAPETETKAEPKKTSRASEPNRRGGRRVAQASSQEVSRNGDIVRTAYSYRGTRYVYGGTGGGGFDCSGFTSYLYQKKGISLPHTARGQASMGRKVDRKDLKAGDLVFFHTVTPGISHVGMYVGNGKFVHASSRRSGGVREDSLDSGYYNQRLVTARRYTK